MAGGVGKAWHPAFSTPGRKKFFAGSHILAELLRCLSGGQQTGEFARIGLTPLRHGNLAVVVGEGTNKMAKPVCEKDGKRDFAAFDGKRIAVVLSIAGQPRVCRGTAVYKPDATLGPVLALRLEGEEKHGLPELLFSETRWTGEICPDTQHGCEYCFVPSTAAKKPPRTNRGSRRRRNAEN
jgi:hypothetical protein